MKPNKRRVLHLEQLEDRMVPVTAAEQFMIELVNRARMDPAAEAQRLGISLNEGLPPGTISATPKQPLAPNALLLSAIHGHLADMRQNNFFAHDGSNGSTFIERVEDAGYINWINVAENLAWSGNSGPQPIDEAIVAQLHRNLFVDEGIAGRGHRVNILNGALKEIGSGVIAGSFMGFNSVLVGQDFATEPGNAFLTGVAYIDNVVDNDFYSIGEGQAGVQISARQGSNVFTTTTDGSGSYALRVPAGTYTITASGGSLPGAVTIPNVVIATQNMKVDIVPATASSRSLDILGRATEIGEWWQAASAVSGFESTLFGTWATNVTWVDVQQGDFNADGLSDIVGRQQQTGEWWVALSTGQAFQSSRWSTWSSAVEWVDVLLGDFTGDGRDDIVGRWEEGGQWWIARSTGTSFTNEHWTTWSPSVTWSDVLVGDFNNDGRDDIAGRWEEGGQWWVGASTGSSFDNDHWATWSAAVTWTDARVGDFNGDGRDDIVARWLEGGQWWAALSTGNAFTTDFWSQWSAAVTWVDARVGDFDNDGRDDIVARWSQGGQWWLVLSDGTNTRNELWGTWNAQVDWTDIVVADFDRDGRSDIVGRWRSGGQWWTARSTGALFETRFLGTWTTTVIWSNIFVGRFRNG